MRKQDENEEWRRLYNEELHIHNVYNIFNEIMQTYNFLYSLRTKSLYTILREIENKKVNQIIMFIMNSITHMTVG